MAAPSELPAFENETFLVEAARDSAVPGHLIIRLKTGETSWGELSEPQAMALGAVVARTVRALEQAAGADRVYCLTFCEVERRLHLHLLPRTAWLLAAYQAATGTRGDAVNGAMLFDWARTQRPGALVPPRAAPDAAEICDAVRARLNA
jgi:diadenosine tetraphosphate (Ap4A) HIT family hydrolase